MNVVTGPTGFPAAVLLRAVVPLLGVDAMRQARTTHALATRSAARADPARTSSKYAREPEARLAQGPGNLCAAFSIDRTANGVDLCAPGAQLHLAARPAGEPAPPYLETPRIGVAYAGEWASRPWRFVVANT